MSEVFWASDWKCNDCGHKVPIEPGQDVRPIEAAHECDSTALALHQTQLAAWVDGYRFALQNYDDPMVRADRDEFGAGWAGMVGQGAIIINVDGDQADHQDGAS